MKEQIKKIKNINIVCKAKRCVAIFLVLIMLVLNASVIFADGWVDDGYGNWLYEENGQYVKNDTRVIDGIPYYFNYQGYWLPRSDIKDVKLKSKENVTFTLEGEDDSNRKYKTEINIVMPVVEGKNADAINEFIRKEFQNAITKYIMEWRKSILFLLPKVEIDSMLEAQNKNGVICFGYFSDWMFNLYLDTKKLEMWAIPNY